MALLRCNVLLAVSLTFVISDLSLAVCSPADGNNTCAATGDTSSLLQNRVDVKAHEEFSNSVAVTNDGKSRNIKFVGTLTCGFETSSEPYCGTWENKKTGDVFDWTRKSGKTPSHATGPDSAKGGAHYLYIETSSPRRSNDMAELVTAQPIPLEAGAYLKFDYHMYGSSMGGLDVFVDSDKVFFKSGDQGNTWKTANVALDTYAGKSVNIKFVGRRGQSWRGDLAIDDIVVFEGSSATGPTTAPTPAPTAAPTPGAPTTVAPTTAAPTAAPTITAQDACNAYWGSGANGRTDCVLYSCGGSYDGLGYVPPSGYNCGEGPIFRTDGVCGNMWYQADQYRYKNGAFRRCSDDGAFDPNAQVSCGKSPYNICDSTPSTSRRDASHMCPGPANTCTAAICCEAASVCSSVTCTDPKKQFKLSDNYKCSGTSCSVGECCRAAAKCDDYTYDYATKSSTTCTGATPLHKFGQDCAGYSWTVCDAATCCEADHTCDSLSCSGDASVNVGSTVTCGRKTKSSLKIALCEPMTCCKTPSCTTFTGTMTKPARGSQPAKPFHNRQAIKRNANSFLFYAVDSSAIFVQEVDGSGTAKGSTSYFLNDQCPSNAKNDAHACILAKCNPSCQYPSSYTGGNWQMSNVASCR